MSCAQVLVTRGPFLSESWEKGPHFFFRVDISEREREREKSAGYENPCPFGFSNKRKYWFICRLLSLNVCVTRNTLLTWFVPEKESLHGQKKATGNLLFLLSSAFPLIPRPHPAPAARLPDLSWALKAALPSFHPGAKLVLRPSVRPSPRPYVLWSVSVGGLSRPRTRPDDLRLTSSEHRANRDTSGEGVSFPSSPLSLSPKLLSRKLLPVLTAVALWEVSLGFCRPKN